MYQLNDWLGNNLKCEHIKSLKNQSTTSQHGLRQLYMASVNYISTWLDPPSILASVNCISTCMAPPLSWRPSTTVYLNMPGALSMIIWMAPPFMRIWLAPSSHKGGRQPYSHRGGRQPYCHKGGCEPYSHKGGRQPYILLKGKGAPAIFS